jgi:integrase
VHKWLVAQAERGSAPSSVMSQLIRLRVVLSEGKASERSEDFPWPTCAPITPATPRRELRNPAVWGGKPGAADPLLPFTDMNRLAVAVRAAFRPAIYLEALGGPRIGENFGLWLGDFSWKDGLLWVSINRQMDDLNRTVAWVKSDASYRDIPLAPILSDYLVAYCRIYHDYDLHNPDPKMAERQLIVHPAGRDVDGSYLPGLRSHFSSSLSKVRDAVGLSYDRLGYWVDTQHLRKSIFTYLLNATKIVCAINEEEDEGEPDDPQECIASTKKLPTRSP